MTVTLLDYIDIAGAMLNLVAVEKEISTAVGQILDQEFNTEAAKPYMRYEAEGVYPKWLNGLTDAKPDEFGIWEDYEPITIRSELQVGKKTAGYDGKLEQQLYTWIPYTLAMGRSRPLLTSDARATRPIGMLGASIRLGRALMPGDIIAAEFIWTLAFFVTNPERDY